MEVVSFESGFKALGFAKHGVKSCLLRTETAHTRTGGGPPLSLRWSQRSLNEAEPAERNPGSS